MAHAAIGRNLHAQFYDALLVFEPGVFGVGLVGQFYVAAVHICVGASAGGSLSRRLR